MIKNDTSNQCETDILPNPCIAYHLGWKVETCKEAITVQCDKCCDGGEVHDPIGGQTLSCLIFTIAL